MYYMLFSSYHQLIRIMTIYYIIIRDIILKVIRGYRGGGEVLTLPPPLEDEQLQYNDL